MRSLQQMRRMLLVSALALPIVACAPKPPLLVTSAPSSVETTITYKSLRSLPAPKRPVPVAVYSYPDLTGQFKPSDTVSTNSRAVTQGAVWMLVKALKDAAGGRWFKVIQRANLENLLRERQIIRETRGTIEKATGRGQPSLPSLLFAGVILEGGIIGYDSNTVTGGLGARYLGIGGDVQYRQDTVTVYLNAISSQTGEVMKSVMTRKTVASYGVRGSVFKFVAFQKLLEGETGYTINEPGQIALAQAIEHAVRALIVEGALEGLWQFDSEIAGKQETQAYLADRGDLLLIGDATSDAALALLTDEQLQELAKRRKEQQREPETRSAQLNVPMAPADENVAIAPSVPSAEARIAVKPTAGKSAGGRRIKVPDSVQLAAQRRIESVFSSEAIKEKPLTFELDRLPHPKPAGPMQKQTAMVEIKSEARPAEPTDRESRTSDTDDRIPVTPIRATPLTLEVDRLPHSRPVSLTQIETATGGIHDAATVVEAVSQIVQTSTTVESSSPANIKVEEPSTALDDPGALQPEEPALLQMIRVVTVERATNGRSTEQVVSSSDGVSVSSISGVP